ncbi:Signal recognition particle receptor subunit alpha [Astathelohania contejeani]|uniref:Signal recognition particle receptor subunit alpha n=1 Tax=Astathelohania contejeani TaxID=164912 RepID=A0ABQ7HXF1_9MICR|nr:Signal recognition particle receptor subunit alpha [Thelohania contejeani]
MLDFLCIFNTKGNILFKNGSEPKFLNNFILSIRLGELHKKMKIQNTNVEYEIRGEIVFLVVSTIIPDNILKNIISLYFTKPENFSKNFNSLFEPQKKKKNIKQRKWIEIGDESELDYSGSNTKVDYIPEASRPLRPIKRGFSLFSSKIWIEELKEKMENQLNNKNVSSEISKRICEDVYYDFKNANINYVTEKMYRDKMMGILSKIITRLDHEKLLNDIRKVNKNGNIFSFCMVGVNGVGKSTSLAKIACWLLQHGFKVYIAACDTFRAGAIEQLKVHVSRFNKAGHKVGLYEKGYNKDDANVARNAIKTAISEGYDVILIDTAGRMHNNIGLMKSLSKIMRINTPNHIIFVGEALVGNDSIEHMKEFNKAIGEGIPNRKFDSIFLTKMDTVDNKIGQVLNMTITSGAPVLFMGIGQTNVDIQIIDVKLIVDILLS